MVGQVKLTNEKSKFKKSEDNSISFDQRTKEIFQNSEQLKEQAAKIALDFVKLFDNKIVTENRKELNIEVERKILNDCVSLALALNTDETQPEGYGGVAWLILICKILLKQHYRINDLEYKLEQIQNKK